MIILADTGLHRAKGDPANVKICRRGQWNVRMIVETVFSMMSVVWHTKTMRHRAWDGFEAIWRTPSPPSTSWSTSTSWFNGTACSPTPQERSVSPSPNSPSEH